MRLDEGSHRKDYEALCMKTDSPRRLLTVLQALTVIGYIPRLAQASEARQSVKKSASVV